jgi:hypothetical protein
MFRPFRLFAFLGALLFLPAITSAATPWVEEGSGGPFVQLYFFYSYRCSHCQEATPFVNGLAQRYPWLQVHQYEVATQPENALLYEQMAQALGQQANSVPGFLFCGEMYTGFDTPQGLGSFLEERLLRCHEASQRIAGDVTPQQSQPPLVLPVMGSVDLKGFSLPVITIILAGLDAFNPCAFFVLLFLLSLLTHERTRARMLVIGGVFVLFSGLVYFALMAAWLNLFLVAGEVRAVTVAAGLVAIIMALMNIKDFVFFKRGPSLSIPESAKPKLYERVRRLLQARSWPMMLAGTVTLAVAANSYEALCTAGFPMVYTRLLTMHSLSGAEYYAYLAFYNLIYVLPLLAIVVALAYTLGSHKLTEREGRVLKLVSGVMMVGLGLALLLAPEQLNNPLLAAGLVILAIATGVVARVSMRKT